MARRRSGNPVLRSVWIVAVAGSACGGDQGEAGGSDVAVRDSAGITIVEFDPAVLPVRQLAAEPTWSFESITTAEGEHVLSGVIPLPLNDGRLAIAERSTTRVWMGTPGSADWTWVGGAGDGPSELRAIADVAPGPNGSVWVFDSSRRRVVRYGQDGAVAEAPAIPDRYWGGGAWSARSGAHYFFGSSRASAASPEGVSRPEVPLVRWAPGSAADTLRSIPGVEWYLFDGGAGGSLLSPTSTGAGALEGHWVGDNARAEIELWTTGPGPRTLVRWPQRRRDMQRVGDSVRTAFVAAVPPEQRVPAVMERIEAFPVTQAEPQFTSLVPRSDGGVAIGPWWPVFGPPAPRPAGVWMVLDASGRPLERVELPRGFVPEWFAEDHVIGVAVDDLGRERVERWEIGE